MTTDVLDLAVANVMLYCLLGHDRRGELAVVLCQYLCLYLAPQVRGWSYKAKESFVTELDH